MKRISSAAIAISALALIATAGAANAQDWTPIWTGPTVGISGGYGWGTSQHNDTDGFHTGNFNVQGALAGGGIGYNYQIQHFVLGAEADYSWADINGKTLAGNQGGCYLPYCTTEAQSIGTARGRLGYAFGRFMPYLTGGFAWGEVHGSEGIAGNAVMGGGRGTKMSTGWTAGTGVEYMIVPGWSAKLEYLHVDLGSGSSFTDTFANHAGFARENVAFQADTVRAGITFHFWAPRPMMAEAAPPPPAPMPAAAPAPAPAPQARTFIVFFDFDKYNLTPDARKVVEEAANAYKAGGSAKVTLAGYTDLSGSVPYNLRLSERRAKTVAAYMSKQGVPASAMDVSWHGKENPRVPTPDGVREPQNRRVEISE